MAKKEMPAAMRKYLAEIGSKGGKQSLKTMTAEERKERAKAATEARWKKTRKVSAGASLAATRRKP
jgi:hypothetical protein